MAPIISIGEILRKVKPFLEFLRNRELNVNIKCFAQDGKDERKMKRTKKAKKGNHAFLAGKNKVEVRFDFEWDILEVIQGIPGRRFVDDARRGKHWTCPLSVESLRTLEKNGFALSDDLVLFLKKTDVAPDQLKAMNVPGLKKNLFPFQQRGVAFIESRGGRALLGDEMGLGKTITALAWLQAHPKKRPAVVVCPAHLKLNWLREIRSTIPGAPNAQVVYGRNTDQPLTGDIIIINYDIFHNSYETYHDKIGRKRRKEVKYSGWIDYILDMKPQVLIVDEAHFIKSNKALRTLSVKKAARRIPHVLALTGTPIVNRPIEGFNIAQIVNPAVFPDFWKYVHHFCAAKMTPFGWDYTGASNKEELHAKLTGSIMIRHRKKDVLPELPDKLYSYVPMELSNAKEYAEAEANFIRFIYETKGFAAASKAKKAEHLVKIEALKQIAVAGKMEQAIQWIDDYLANNGKLVLFATHKDIIAATAARFGKNAVRIDGGTPEKKRAAAVNAFQRDKKVKLFIGNIQAAGTGLTLTAASSVAFLELPWTPGELVQAEDRCHRIGQKDTVNVYYLLADGTIEEKIAELLDRKRKTLDMILDGKEVDEQNLLTELMKTFAPDIPKAAPPVIKNKGAAYPKLINKK